MKSGIHGFGIRNPANGIRNPTIVIQNPGCWNPVCCDGLRPLRFLLQLLRENLMPRGDREDAQQTCSRVFHSQEHPLSGINLKQCSHYDDVTESQGVIHITVLSVFIRHPFDLFPRCSLGVGGLDSFLFGRNRN